MKTLQTLALTVGIATVVLSGCGQKESTTETPKPVAPAEQAGSSVIKQVNDTAATVAADTKKVVTEQTAAAKEAAANVTAAAQATASDATAKAQELIKQAQSLFTEKKYSEAMTSLQQLSTVKLTAEQQKLVDGLKTQIQAALAKSSVGNVLGGSK